MTSAVRVRVLLVLFEATAARLPAAVAWLRQPSTIYGLAALAGVVAGWLEGSVSVSSALPVAVGALVAIAIPEHPGAAASAARIAQDAVLLAQPGRQLEAGAKLGADIEALAASESGASANCVPAPTVTM